MREHEMRSNPYIISVKILFDAFIYIYNGYMFISGKLSKVVGKALQREGNFATIADGTALKRYYFKNK